MILIKTILEALDDTQKNEVDRWHQQLPPETKKSIFSVFKGKTKLTTPLLKTDTPTPPEIEHHLSSEGYKITDYIKNEAIDKYGRKTTVGRALERTRAPQSIKQSFAQDPSRQQQKDDMTVVISHHPYDVAGMTSGEQPWSEQSCMNYHNGVNKHFLPVDVKEGTHAAYLIDKEDEDIEHPYARIALKPFHAQDGSGHTIFRPEHTTYGNAPSSFAHTVTNWANEKYPAKEGVNYERNKLVYTDNGGDSHIYNPSKKEIVDTLDSDKFPSKFKFSGLPNDKLDFAVNHAINMDSRATAKKIIMQRDNNYTTSALTKDHINGLYKKVFHKNDNDLHKMVAISGIGDSLNKENLGDALSFLGGKVHLFGKVLGNPNLPKEIVDKVPTDKLHMLHPLHIDKEKTDRFFSSPTVEANVKHESYENFSKFNHHIKKEHIDKILDAMENHAGSINTKKPFRTFNELNSVTPEHINRLHKISQDTEYPEFFHQTIKNIEPENIKDSDDALEYMQNNPSKKPHLIEHAVNKIIDDHVNLSHSNEIHTYAHHLKPYQIDKLIHKDHPIKKSQYAMKYLLDHSKHTPEQAKVISDNLR